MASNSRLYSKGVISKKITIPYDKITNDIQRLLLSKIIKRYEDKCILEGYIKKNSCKLLQYSSGIMEANKVKFDIMFECEICFLLFYALFHESIHRSHYGRITTCYVNSFYRVNIYSIKC